MKGTLEESLSHARYECDMAGGDMAGGYTAELQEQQAQFQRNVLLAALAVYWSIGGIRSA
jgi:hypothetical protein